MTGRSAPIQRALEINGSRPFAEAGYPSSTDMGDVYLIEVDIYVTACTGRRRKPRWRKRF